jgi:hypothetical protein
MTVAVRISTLRAGNGRSAVLHHHARGALAQEGEFLLARAFAEMG